MFRARTLRRVMGFLAVLVMATAGLASAHARTHVAPVVKAAPCHEAAKSAKDVCQEICASALPDHVLTATPAVRTPVLVQPVVYEVLQVIPAPSRFLMAAARWHPPPGEGLPPFLRHQRLLI